MCGLSFKDKLIVKDNELSFKEGELIKDIIKVEDNWWQGTSEDGIRSGLFPANFVKSIDPKLVFPENCQALPSAKALFNYAAEDLLEISFSEGQIITNIKFTSDDWWEGTTESGALGFFPG
ncbi:11410_t:CDS:2 [Diversispora eburnea]|uniref:11410_t:CDS:1 n=1 Tax=Diversispora eburnea TaxID=1213867 RepID=A0A9N8VPI1_9GLOM|nr:11410_t:CDS:2 [Diversispora eburnea]